MEIPEQHRSTVRQLYRLWLLVPLLLFWNFIACFSLLLSHASGVTTAATDFGGSITNFFLIGIASFYLWYRPVYNAFMKESSFYFYMFFIFGGFHFLFSIYMMIGIPGSGSGGLINMISMYSDSNLHYISGTLCLIDSLLWSIMTIFMGILWKKVQRHFSASGMTVDQARNEVVTGVATSQMGKHVGKAVIGSYIKSGTAGEFV